MKVEQISDLMPGRSHHPLVHKWKNRVTSGLWSVFRGLLLLGISFVIIYPLLQKCSVAFKAKEDIYNPTIYMVPINYTWENILLALELMDYWSLLANTVWFVAVTTFFQAVSCALAGYGFARFHFPGNNMLFALVILTILVPMTTLMIPMYLHFRAFDLFGLIKLITGREGINLLNSYWPQLIMSMTANGLKSGLYIYIFRQFFRSMPGEIEEAALIDGAGGLRTFLFIMMPNAIPPLITVILFASVWQYNDTFYASLFMNAGDLMSLEVAALPANADQQIPILMGISLQSGAKADPNHVAMIVDTGILLAILPLMILYLFVQRYFVESVERTGVVG